MKNTGYYLCTLWGILSIILWASSIAFSKSVMETEGSLNAAFYIYFYSGILIFFLLLIFQKKTVFSRKTQSLPLSYHLKTGIFFVLNNVLLFIAVGLAEKNEEIVIVTLLNYTWPILIYIVGIPVLKLKISVTGLLPGIILSFFGIAIALLQGYSSENIGHILRAGNDNILAYSLAFLTALSWALYSNMTAKYRSKDDLAGIPVVFLISGLVFLIILGLKGQLSTIHFAAPMNNPDLVYMIVGPTALGYLGWYFAMKHGNKDLVTSLSFFIPLLSILIIRFRFKINVGILFWFSAVLLIAGSYICYKSFRSDTPWRVRTNDTPS